MSSPVNLDAVSPSIFAKKGKFNSQTWSLAWETASCAGIGKAKVNRTCQDLHVHHKPRVYSELWIEHWPKPYLQMAFCYIWASALSAHSTRRLHMIPRHVGLDDSPRVALQLAKQIQPLNSHRLAGIMRSNAQLKWTITTSITQSQSG